MPQKPSIPPEIGDSLHKFQTAFGRKRIVGFLMMRFVDHKPHKEISQAIRETCAKHDIAVVRADDTDFHSHLYWNILTCCHGCAFGIAVFERIETEAFNPNISYEVGYLHALRRPVCILKDRTLDTLHTDLIGNLYKTFDPHSPRKSIPRVLTKWLDDNGFLPGEPAAPASPTRPPQHTYPPFNIGSINLTDTRILQRLIQGRSPREIAHELGVSMQRVYSVSKRHRDVIGQ